MPEKAQLFLVKAKDKVCFGNVFREVKEILYFHLKPLVIFYSFTQHKNMIPSRMSQYEALLSQLYYRYKQERAIDMSQSQFYPLIFTFPPLLVAAADGIVDDMERETLTYIVKNLAFSFSQDGMSYTQMKRLADSYVAEFGFLIDNLKRYETDFISTLFEYLCENQEAKPDIKEMLIASAEASDGISDIEQQTIDHLTLTLQLD